MVTKCIIFINYFLQVLVNNSTVNTINYFEVSNLPLLPNKKHIENIKKCIFYNNFLKHGLF